MSYSKYRSLCVLSDQLIVEPRGPSAFTTVSAFLLNVTRYVKLWSRHLLHLSDPATVFVQVFARLLTSEEGRPQILYPRSVGCVFTLFSIFRCIWCCICRIRADGLLFPLSSEVCNFVHGLTYCVQRKAA